MGDMHKNSKDLRRSRFTVSLVGIFFVLFYGKFCYAKKILHMSRKLDVQDDKSVCAVGQILCGGEVINKRKYK